MSSSEIVEREYQRAVIQWIQYRIKVQVAEGVIFIWMLGVASHTEEPIVYTGNQVTSSKSGELWVTRYREGCSDKGQTLLECFTKKTLKILLGFLCWAVMRNKTIVNEWCSVATLLPLIDQLPANGCPCWGISIKEGLEVTGLTHSPRRTLSNQQTHKSKSKKVLFGGAVGRSSKKQILIPFWICCFSQHGPPNQNKQRMHVQLHRLSNVKPVLEVERVAQFTLSFPKKRQRRN